MEKQSPTACRQVRTMFQNTKIWRVDCCRTSEIVQAQNENVLYHRYSITVFRAGQLKIINSNELTALFESLLDDHYRDVL